MQSEGTANYSQKGHHTRKKSSFASSPLRKKRANHLNKMRTDMSGSSAADSVKQQGTELQPTTKKKKKNRDSQSCWVWAGTHYVKTGDKTLSTAFTELDKRETAKKEGHCLYHTWVLHAAFSCTEKSGKQSQL